jgi:hypothetical protein
MKRVICVLLTIIIIGAVCGFDQGWEDTLYVPTQITKIDNKYFIVDCLHSRVIYSDDISSKLSDWKLLTKTNRGHSLASDGAVLLHDDTEDSSILVFSKNDKGDFYRSQTISDVTGRPHYIMYDKDSDLFYALASEEGKIYILKNNHGIVSIVDSFVVEPNNGCYIRSFDMIDGHIYLISGNGNIYKIKYKNPGYEIVDSYKVPDSMVVMNNIIKIDDYYYLTSFQNSYMQIAPTFVRTKDLSGLYNGNYEDLYKLFNFNSTPYFITLLDGKYYITEIGEKYNSIKSFESKQNKINNIQDVFSYDEVLKNK